MHYLKSLFIRLLLCFLPLSWFSFLLTPLTVYGSYIFLFPFLDVVVNGRILTVNGFPFEIVEACVATTAYYLLWLLCFLTKEIEVKTRFKIIIYGFLLIFGMNIFRIFLLVFIAMNYGFDWFSLVHLTFWNFVSGIYVALVWVFLVRKYKVYSIPIYDDMKNIYKMALLKKKIHH